MPETLVVDASAMVDMLVGSHVGIDVGERLRDKDVHVPAHFDAEVISALGRLHRAGDLTQDQVEERVDLTAEAPIQRHLLAPLLQGAWQRHHNVRIVDALYIELATHINARIMTTDAGMASASPLADLVLTR
jgi:predicted nucleic acid-binding protein